MTDNEQEKLKLYFKLKTGEEFEAQGSQAFISEQKEAFLKLINPQKAQTEIAGQRNSSGNIFSRMPDESLKSTPLTLAGSQEQNAAQGQQSFLFPSYKRKESLSSATKEPSKTPIMLADKEVWDKVSYTDGTNIIIRRKDKALTPSLAALIILGSAKMLKDTPRMSAIDLSKSLKLSGYLPANTRLDRILGPEIKEDTVFYEGTKRNRFYHITQKGLAKAYSQAEKIILGAPYR